MLGGRLGLVYFMLLVFLVHRESMRGQEEAGSWIAQSAGQGSAV